MDHSHWALLGFACWTLLLVVVGIGLPRISAVLSRRARPNSFVANVPHGSERYQRTMRAHMNCVENLPVFAVLVLLGSAADMREPTFQAAALLVLPARVLQSITHVASGSNRATVLRFVFFAAQLVCFGVMAFLLVQSSG